jgi:hypothetical protein
MYPAKCFYYAGEDKDQGPKVSRIDPPTTYMGLSQVGIMRGMVMNHQSFGFYGGFPTGEYPQIILNPLDHFNPF